MKNLHRLLLLTFLITGFVFLGFGQGFQELGEFENDQANSNYARTIASENEIVVVGCEVCGTSGEVFVYSNCDGNLTRIATLTVSTGVPNGALFGRSVDIKGDVIAVGNRFGAVYVYEKPAGGWQDMDQTATLSGLSTSNRTGELVKITDKYILAMNDPTSPSKSLSIFEKPGANWTNMSETARINRPNVIGVQSQQFARGFDAYGDTILVASANNDNPGYLYFKPAGGWSSASPITIPDVSLESSGAVIPSTFSRSAVLTEDHAYISIQSEPVRVYVKPSVGWSSVNSVVESYQLSSSSAVSSLFGFSMEVLADSILAVGDPTTNEGYVNIYYKNANGSWSSKTEDQSVMASNGASGDRFGIGLSFNEKNTLVVGADDTDRNGETDAGSFYSFVNEDLSTQAVEITNLPPLFTVTESNDLVSFSPNGTITVLATISEANFSPRGDLLEASNKLLYGVSATGGSANDGFIYKINPDGRDFEIVHEFDGSLSGQTGSSPSEALIEVNGKLLGGTFGDNEGNPLSLGTIYSMNLDGSGFNTIYTLTSGKSIRTLYEASNGFIYSAINSTATEIFRVNPDGSGFTSIVDQSLPGTGVTNFVENLAEYNDKLYGLVNGGGSQGDGYIFSIDLNTDAFSIVYNLDETIEGRLTSTGLEISEGVLYGSTLLGGSNNDGTIFSYDINSDVANVLYDYSASAFDKSGFSLSSDGFLYGFMKTGGANGDGQLLKIDLYSVCDEVLELVPFESAISAGPISKPVEIINTPPIVLSEPGLILGEEDDPDFSIDLSSSFDASDEPITNLDLVIESNSNPSLFSSLVLTNSDDITQASLDVSLAPDAFGNADVVIKVRDARGGEAMVTQQFEIDAIPDVPSVTSANTTYGQSSSSGLVITSNAVDVVFPINNFRISNITNGTLFTSDDVQVTEGDFITSTEGSTGLRWEPTSATNGSFEIQAAFSPTSLRSDPVVANITVSKADLTMTADDFSRAYNEDNPSFTVSYSGFVNNEDASFLLSQPSVSTVGDLGESVGTYDLVPFGATADNYAISFVNGTLTITEAALSVLADDEIITYGQSLPVFSGVLTGVLNGDNITASFGTTEDGQTVGTFAITGSINDPDNKLSNYTVTNTDGTLTISQATLTAVANDKSIVFGEAIPVLDGVLSGVVNGDNVTASYATTATISSDAGTYPITVSLEDPDTRLSNYSTTLTDGTLAINKADQTITFGTIADIDLENTNTVTLAASTDSGLPITYTLDEGDGSITGTTLTVNGTGNFEVTASQGGDTNYNAAASVTRAFQVTDSRKADQTITFTDDLSELSYGDAAVTVTATASSSLPVTYTTTGPISVSGTTLSILGAGEASITANQEGNDDFNPATGVTQTFTIAKAPLNVQPNDKGITYGENFPVFDGTLTGVVAGDNIEAIYSSGADPEAGTYDITATLTDADNRLGNYDVTIETGTLTITQATLSATANDQQVSFGEALPMLDGTLTGVVNGDNITATYTTTATTGTDVGTYPIMVSLIDPDTRLGNYATTLTDGTLTIIKADQTITFPAIGDVDIASTTTVTLAATSDAGLEITYTLDQGDGSIAGNSLTINNTGTFIVTAAQAGNTNYNAATNVSQSFTVTDSRKQDQTITFNAISEQTYGDDLTLNATASSNLPITYTLNAGTGTIANGVLTIEGVGTYEVIANQEGDNDFNPAQAVTQTFTSVKAPLTATADDQSINEGEDLPTLTITYTGFKLMDDVTDLETEPTISTTATAPSPAGAYPITLTGGSDENYDFSLTNGTLTIREVLGVGENIIEVYPNPATAILKVEGLDYEELRLFDLEGKEVLKTDKQRVSVAEIGAGIYILRLYNQGKEVHNQKIIIN